MMTVFSYIQTYNMHNNKKKTLLLVQLRLFEKHFNQIDVQKKKFILDRYLIGKCVKDNIK